MAGVPEAQVRYTVLSVGDSRVSPERDDASDGILRRLHRLATREMLAAEIMARSIAEYPEMPWEFMLDMARVCRDKVRRAEARKRRMERLGGRLGSYPIHPEDWALYQHRVKLDLAYRLCDLAALGEAPLGIELATMGETQGDSLHPSRHADERYIQDGEKGHVRSSVRWLKWLTMEDVGKLHQIIERGKKLRAKSGLESRVRRLSCS